LPVSVNGQAATIKDIIVELNAVAGGYGVGRFNGVEDTGLGTKNHEVREAPAAQVILTARKHLEQVALSAEELRLKHLMDSEWTRLVVRGGWYSDLKQAIGAFISETSRHVSGEVDVTMAPGSAFVRNVTAWRGLGADSEIGQVVAGQPVPLALDTIRLLSRARLS
jgi:argininosuccinate synthase